MIEVRYPVTENSNVEVHKIDIRKIERIESDGTFLVRGKENGYNVLMHLDVDGFGRFHKLPTKGTEYIKLMMPYVKRVDVTKSLEEQLNGQEIDAIPAKEKPTETIKMYYHPTLKKMFILKDNAIKLGFIKGEITNKDPKGIIDSEEAFNNYYEVKDFEFETIKEKYKIEVFKFDVRAYTKESNDDIKEFNESRIAKLLMDLRYYIYDKGNIDETSRRFINSLITRERIISTYPNSEYKNELLNILYYDMTDVLSTVRGLNLSDERVANYNNKVDSFIKLLTMKEKDIDLSIVKELLLEIENNINEAFRLTSAIDPSTWLLIETFINNLSDVLLQNDPETFRRQIRVFNKENLLYNQIIFQLRNYIEGKNQVK